MSGEPPLSWGSFGGSSLRLVPLVTEKRRNTKDKLVLKQARSPEIRILYNSYDFSFSFAVVYYKP